MQLDRATLVEAYRRMATIRAFEERVGADSVGGLIPGFVHLYVGEEASAVGVCMNLADTDWIGSTHRGHGHCIAKGCDVEGMMLEIHGKQGGLCNAKGGSMHISDMNVGMLGANGIVGGGPPLVVGAALSAKLLKTSAVSVAFLGDGASNQGTVAEALNMAVVLKVPAIFVIENNGYAEFTATDYHSAGVDLAKRAAAFGLKTETVDGSDFFAVHEASAALIARARAESLPAVLEVKVNRWSGHFTGDPQPYRSAEELGQARGIDPLRIFREKVIGAGLLDEATFAALDAAALKLIEDSSQKAVAAPYPDISELTTDVYVSY